MVTEKDFIVIKITNEDIKNAKIECQLEHGRFEFKLQEAIKKRNGKKSTDFELKESEPIIKIVKSYWVEMNIWEQYSGSGQMNYYYNSIIKLAELGIDVDGMFAEWNSHKEEWRNQFDKSMHEMDIIDNLLEEEGNSGLNTEHNFATWIEIIIHSLPDPMIARIELNLIRDDLDTNGQLYLIDTLKRIRELRHLWKKSAIEIYKEFDDISKKVIYE
jgi:hypothetical protein